MVKRKINFSPVSLKSANFSTVLSISLVLFMLGFMLLFIFHAYNASNTLKENVSFTVYLIQGTPEEQSLALAKDISKNKNVKSAEYVSSEMAAKMMSEIMGEDHLNVLDSINPYQASIVVNLKADALNIDNVRKFITSVESKDIVDNVDYRHDLVQDINSVIYKVSAFGLAFVICLLIIAITLINHTIRLTIHAKRFQIRTMELVGAKPSFIRKPFLAKGFFFGLWGAFIADVLLAGIIIWISYSFKGIVLQEYYPVYAIAGGLILCFGIIISSIFSYISVLRYMHNRAEQLHR